MGMTGLMLGTQRGDVDIVKTLLDSHANPNILEKVSTTYVIKCWVVMKYKTR